MMVKNRTINGADYSVHLIGDRYRQRTSVSFDNIVQTIYMSIHLLSFFSVLLFSVSLHCPHFPKPFKLFFSLYLSMYSYISARAHPVTVHFSFIFETLHFSLIIMFVYLIPLRFSSLSSRFSMFSPFTNLVCHSVFSS